MPSPTLTTVDPSTIPTLTGRLAPVHTETDAADVQVEGSLAADLHGVFVRNGPNPKFDPLGSYTYPMDGDGMLPGCPERGVQPVASATGAMRCPDGDKAPSM